MFRYTIAVLGILLCAGHVSAGTSDSVDLAVDQGGHVYAVYNFADQVQVFDTVGKFLRSWGSPAPGAGQLFGPYGIAIDAKGCLYVSSFGRYVQKFTTSGKYVGRLTTVSADHDDADVVAVDRDGGVYVLLARSNTVVKYSPGGKVVQRIYVRGRDKTDIEPSAIAVDSKNNLYAVFRSGHISKYGKSGQKVACWNVTDKDGNKVELVDITISDSGSIYVLGHHSAWKLGKTGKVESGIDFWVPGENPDLTCPYPPQAIAVDRRGCIYIGYDTFNSPNLEKYDPSWKLVRKWALLRGSR